MLIDCRQSLEEDDEIALQTEVDILSQIDHPNVVKLYEIFDDKDCMYLVLELMTGGEVNLKKTKRIVIRQNRREGTLLRA
jgi:serine/threonine protein kinase